MLEPARIAKDGTGSAQVGRTYQQKAGITVSTSLKAFVECQLLNRLDQDPDEFWDAFASLVAEFTPENRRLLARRDELQAAIDAWHTERKGQRIDADAYKSFLIDIGYIEPTPEPFTIETENVDPEIAEIPGPQLVVPVDNARFALNAANARWNSLFDALYGTDMIPETDGREKGKEFNKQRGEAVIEFAMDFLDRTIPLVGASYRDFSCFAIDDNTGCNRLVAMLTNGETVELGEGVEFIGSRTINSCRRYLLRHNRLHIEIQTNPMIRRNPEYRITDVMLESAVTTIMDCEDSVAAVSRDEKLNVYRNWLGLMDASLEARFDSKRGFETHRTLNRDTTYEGPNGEPVALRGTGLQLVRNVGLLTTTNLVLDADGNEVHEGILDAIITTGCALINRQVQDRMPNSRFGSIYIVKPKMHGSEEVSFTDKLFTRVEELFGIRPNTIKMGVMDEERRTSINLEACVHAARKRIVFINTGFLDRTGDEIHTSMQAGAVLPKGEIKNEDWIAAYEGRNVEVGLKSGFSGRAQIGKGMWAMPDEMRQMVDQKQGHPIAGANCAWVPSPTAATLHAMHYHDISVISRQDELVLADPIKRERLLKAPIAASTDWDDATIQAELDNNIQGILGYVVRWVDQGIGCSKVPDINGVGLMEDRATLRISSQHVANWLLHGIVSEHQVRSTLRRMATVVDEQNARDPNYTPMSDDFDASIAFQAASDLILQGLTQPNGYTEPVLIHHRRRRIAELAELATG